MNELTKEDLGLSKKQEEYLSTQKRIVAFATVARQIDIESFLAAISNAEAAGSLFDPTLYLRGIDNLNALKRLALAIREVQEAAEQLAKAIIQTNVREAGRKTQETTL